MIQQQQTLFPHPDFAFYFPSENAPDYQERLTLVLEDLYTRTGVHATNDHNGHPQMPRALWEPNTLKKFARDEAYRFANRNFDRVTGKKSMSNELSRLQGFYVLFYLYQYHELLGQDGFSAFLNLVLADMEATLYDDIALSQQDLLIGQQFLLEVICRQTSSYT